MNFTIKKLDGGGDLKVQKMIEAASILGVDLIELLWKDSNGLPRYSVAEVIGPKVPVISKETINFDDGGTSDAMWIDGTVHFYPDVNGRCWGYIFDTSENRDHLYRSFNNNWFMIVDKRTREEIKEEAIEKGYVVDAAERVEIQIKKTQREQAAEQHAKTLARKLEEMEMKKKELEKELAIAKGEKMVHVEKRLKGIKVPNRDEILEETNAN
jgi:hypothetical protein